MLEIVDVKCSICGQGEPLSSGVHAGGDGKGRVRWASWTCGHIWSAATEDTKPARTAMLRKVLAVTGLRRHGPISVRPS